jgi:hypothetical protein
MSRNFNKLSINEIYPTNEGCFIRVVDVMTGKKILVEFLDDYKHQVYSDAYTITKGSLKNSYNPSVSGRGFIGVGEYTPTIDSKHTPAYVLWKAMFYRCYSAESLEKSPTYIDCYVSEKWYNFQNFAGWFYSQSNWKLNYELDKDLLYSGNKVYSEETCCLIPKDINSSLVKVKLDSQGSLGVRQSSSGKYTTECRINKVKVHLGSFDSVVEAQAAYLEAKKQQMNSLAKQYESTLSEAVLERLKNWSI